MSSHQSAQFIRLESVPDDTISDLSFSNSQPLLAATSWNNSIHLWQISEQAPKPSHIFEFRDTTKDAMTCCVISPDNDLIFGTARGEIKKIPFGQAAASSVGQHQGVVVNLKWNPSKNVVVSASNDNTVRLWDLRASSPQTMSVTIPKRAISMDCNANMAFIAMLDVQVASIDFRQSNAAPTNIPTEIPAQLTSIATDNDGDLALGCIQGCVEIKIAGGGPQAIFPCHRNESSSNIYQVNCVSLSNERKGAISGGGDGRIAFFNVANGRKASEVAVGQGKIPVTACAIASHGGVFAVATGYDWSTGVEEYMKGKPPVDIFLRKFTPSDIG